MLSSLILLSLTSTSLALVSVPLDKRAIGGSCTTPVRSASRSFLRAQLTILRTEQALANKLRTVQPKDLTWQVTVQALQASSVASRRAVALLRAPASA